MHIILELPALNCLEGAGSRYSRCLNGKCVSGIEPTSAYYAYYGEFDNGVVKDLPDGQTIEKGSPRQGRCKCISLATKVQSAIHTVSRSAFCSTY